MVDVTTGKKFRVTYKNGNLKSKTQVENRPPPSIPVKRGLDAECNFPDGVVYRGQLMYDASGNKKRHGTGAMQFSNGQLYTGEWKDYNREGRGLMTWKEGVLSRSTGVVHMMVDGKMGKAWHQTLIEGPGKIYQAIYESGKLISKQPMAKEVPPEAAVTTTNSGKVNKPTTSEPAMKAASTISTLVMCLTDSTTNLVLWLSKIGIEERFQQVFESEFIGGEAILDMVDPVQMK
ncbi:hypothetical protein Pelo_16146 [Pelomyxa schiedti]|nr:hypothetical protein Pelo_16146 [Pelomyxa schiedti]